MFITHLSLTNFRNYPRLELDLPQQVAVFRGDNAQGKTNLLEAVYLLATARSSRARVERELINWSAGEGGVWVARLNAGVQRARGKTEVEIVLLGSRGEAATVEGQPSHVHKRIRVNGITRRAIDLVGQVNVVMFGAQDIELIGGAPSLRRRYLDVANSQVDQHYLHTLQRYQRVLEQRNHLLRSIQEHRAQLGQLDFWDQKLVEDGSQLIVARHHLVEALSHLAHSVYQELTSDQGDLELVYHPSIGREALVSGCQPDGVAGLFQQALSQARGREIALGMTLVGPHRDDVRFLVNKVDMSAYGSRGEQRTVVLSLKLAEARFMLNQVDEHPILLLDDVLSELDLRRRHRLMDSIFDYQQVLITTTDMDQFHPELLSQAALFEVRAGSVQRV